MSSPVELRQRSDVRAWASPGPRVSRDNLLAIGVPAVAGFSLSVGLIFVATPVAYADGAECSQIRGDTESEATTTASQALAALQIQETHQVLADQGKKPGQGQTVAILDSGVVAGLNVIEGHQVAGTPAIEDYQGTALAGLVVGPPAPLADGSSAAPHDSSSPIGIAPAARVVDVQVYDAVAPTEEGQVGVELGRVVAGLRWVAANARRLSIDVANVSVVLPSADPSLKDAVRAVTEAGVIVVTSGGDVPSADDPGSEKFLNDDGGVRTGIDARSSVWPAGYDEVVAVSASAPPGEDAFASVLPNSQVDIAVPTAQGVSYALNGRTCALPEVSSRVAAAEVTAILALLKSAYPKDSNAQLLSRLFDTATGGGSDPTTGGEAPSSVGLSEAGVAQPLEALRRPLRPRRDGGVEAVSIAEEELDAQVPVDQPDALAQIREDGIWFGLLGGGLLTVALLLRPVLSRRRGEIIRR